MLTPEEQKDASAHDALAAAIAHYKLVLSSQLNTIAALRARVAELEAQEERMRTQ